MDNQHYILLLELLFLPLLAGLLSYATTNKTAGWVFTLLSALVLIEHLRAYFTIEAGSGIYASWMTIGSKSIILGLYYDELSALMALAVALITVLVALFSIAYMQHDKSQNRYFGLLGIFAFSMYGIILSSNLLLTFIFWELVGFSSYLLIGFWFQKSAPPRSSFKAFLMNKVGDAGFLFAIFILYSFVGTLDIQEIILTFNNQSDLLLDIPNWAIHALGFGLFLAAIGKSAQFPLQTWLPDAMTGPTPVSALIHAATMVAAGVYLMVRAFPVLSPEILTLIGCIGSVTAFMGAFAAFAQHDIKKILAFSTVSQLGFMMMAIGAGYPAVGFFHLITHAFFKAGLFLCAGSIIHFYHEKHSDFDAQDIRNMGGLRKILPITFVAFSVCMLSLAGLPLFSGYLSKEMIMTGLFEANHLPDAVVWSAFMAVFMTAAYMGRLYFKVFFGQRENESNYQESYLIKIPLLVLAGFSFWFVFAASPLDTVTNEIIDKISGITAHSLMGHYTIVPVLSIGLSILGLVISYLHVETKLLSPVSAAIKKTFYDLSYNHFYLDAFHRKAVVQGHLSLSKTLYFFDKKILDAAVDLMAKTQVIIAFLMAWFDKSIVDGLVKFLTWTTQFVGNRTRKIQGGNVQLYFVWALFGLLIIFYLMN